MVSVCAGCDGFQPWAGLLIGTIAGVLYVLFSKMMTKLKIDDPLDAVAVHMGSGFWGLVAAPLFLPDGHPGIFIPFFSYKNPDPGIVYTGSSSSLMRLAWNMAGAGAFIAWQTVCGILMFGFLKVSQSVSLGDPG